MSRIEPILVGFFFASWGIAILYLVGLVPLPESLNLSLYGLYTVAAVSGWLAGNVYVHRARHLPRELKRRAFLLYFFGPPGLLYLLRSMAPAPVQRAAPLVPLYAWAVFSIFFLVPLTFRARRPRPPRSGQRSDDGG
ncbi:MAG TPA: hypothetical protein VKA53_02375 [Thermoanaerobaculia bacterium]|nr:hypothetical protein [Thermoanaerobaculia bacterium]